MFCVFHYRGKNWIASSFADFSCSPPLNYFKLFILVSGPLMLSQIASRGEICPILKLNESLRVNLFSFSCCWGFLCPGLILLQSEKRASGLGLGGLLFLHLCSVRRSCSWILTGWTRHTDALISTLHSSCSDGK